MSITEQRISDGGLVEWTSVCDLERLVPDRGVAALIDGHVVALFRLSSGDLHAVDNVDPISGASVMSRGLVGDVGGTATIASPMYKQRFELCSGRCLDDDEKALCVHDVRVVDGVVHVRLSGAP